MVQAYLGKPDYTNAMNQGLRTRLAYDQARRPRRGGGGGGGGGAGSAPLNQDGPMGSPQQREAHRARMRTEEAEEIKNEQARANVEKTKKATNEMGKVSPEDKETKRLVNLMRKEKIEDVRVTRAKGVMRDAGQWAPQITQESYRDMFELVQESDAVAARLMVSPDTVEAMSPVEWKVHHSKLNKVFDPTGKKITAEIKAQEKEDKETLEAEKRKEVGYKEFIRIQAAIDKIGNTGGLDDAEYESLPAAVKAFLKGKDHTKYLEYLNEYANNLVAKHDLEPMAPPQEEVAPPPVEPGSAGQLDQAGAMEFKKQAGGDLAKARQMAIDAGYTIGIPQ